MSVMDPATLLKRLLALPRETEWVGWKEDDCRPPDFAVVGDHVNGG